MIAFHKSGHALLAWLLAHVDPLTKVTIIPHGRVRKHRNQLEALARTLL